MGNCQTVGYNCPCGKFYRVEGLYTPICTLYDHVNSGWNEAIFANGYHNYEAHYLCKLFSPSSTDTQIVYNYLASQNYGTFSSFAKLVYTVKIYDNHISFKVCKKCYNLKINSVAYHNMLNIVYPNRHELAKTKFSHKINSEMRKRQKYVVQALMRNPLQWPEDRVYEYVKNGFDIGPPETIKNDFLIAG